MAIKPELIRPQYKYKNEKGEVYRIINFDVTTKAGKVKEGMITWENKDKIVTGTIFEFAEIVDQEIPKEK